ncbi:MAG: RNA polymerase sigma-70 factor (ECF subfamily) [Salibacteraceae bacterium]|jgi:RNA polymerase sigma-70 factor (ECF subfamily)
MHLFEMIEEMEEDDSSGNKKKLFRCLSVLKDDDLQLIEMRYFEKRSYREIGEIIEITENNAKVRTFRALERLKKLFMK